MKKTVLIVLTMVLGLAAFVAIAQAQTDGELLINLNPPVNIIAPPPEVPKELAPFSGRFEGTWGATRGPFILICEQIANQGATIVYALPPVSTHFKSEGGGR